MIYLLPRWTDTSSKQVRLPRGNFSDQFTAISLQRSVDSTGHRVALQDAGKFENILSAYRDVSYQQAACMTTTPNPEGVLYW